MAKVILQAAAIAVVVFVLAVASLTIWRSLHPSDPQNKTQGPLRAEAKDNHAVESKSLLDRTVEDPVAFFTLWLTLFTGILAAFTIWMALSTKDLRDFAEEQARDMKQSIAVAKDSADAAKRSAEVSENTLIATQRPWISVTSVEIVSPLVFGPHNDGKITLILKVKNVGNSPAIRLWWNTKLVLLNTTNLLSEQKSFCDSVGTSLRGFKSANAIRPEIRLFPGEEQTLVADTYINPDELESARAWATKAAPFPIALLGVIGCIHYEFTFSDGLHQTGLMYKLQYREIVSAERSGPVSGEMPGALKLDQGAIDKASLVLTVDFVGNGPID